MTAYAPKPNAQVASRIAEAWLGVVRTWKDVRADALQTPAVRQRKGRAMSTDDAIEFALASTSSLVAQ